jgi:hypothetical protein
VTYILLNQEQETRSSAAKCLELAPFVSVNFVLKAWRYNKNTFLELIVDAMRKT